MKLRERNWYVPSWLNWVPDVHVEGHTAPNPAPSKPPAGPPQCQHARRRRERVTRLAGS
jgi:hypothetical protein